jgi:hypothetical protein
MPRGHRTDAAADAARRVAATMTAGQDDTLTDNGQPADTTTELVLSNGRSERDQKYADLIVIVHTAETLRYDAQTTVDLETQLDAASDLLATARAQEANREIVDPAILRELKGRWDRATYKLEGWLLQRGIKDEDGGS